MPDDVGNCRACRSKILWAITDKEKRMPVDLGESPDGNLDLYRDDAGVLRVKVVKKGEGKNLPHFATCSKKRI